MDNLSSPISVTSSPATAPSSATKQPTYTTAGTLWNPSASQPLQPPTRRGRSFKWTMGGPNSDLTLLPKSVLASLPLKANIHRTPSFQRYTPLQQNYDRAVSPFSDRDHHLVNMSPQMPRMRSGNTPAPLVSLISQLDKDKMTEEHASEGDDDDDTGDDDDDSDFNMNPLLNMTVKSLNNLASYPNPNQRRAQKALYGRNKPIMPGHGFIARASAPSSPPPRPINSSSFSMEGQAHMPVLHAAQSDPSLLRHDEHRGRATPNSHRITEGNDCFWDSGRTRSELPPVPTPGTPGPGAPKPLTAGPPGQRQYRPSTFESTFKALQNKQGVHTPGTDDEDTVAITRQTMRQAGIDDADITAEAFLSPLGIHVPSSPGLATGSAFENHPDMGAENRSNATDRNIPGSLPRSSLLNAHGPCVMDLRNVGQDYSQSYHDMPQRPVPQPFRLFNPGTDRLSDKAIKARNQRIEQYWYEGTDLLGKSTEEVLIEVGQRSMARKLGTIGDGRPQRSGQKYEPIDIEEANRMSVAEHARPLLDLAFAALLQTLEEDGYNHQQPRAGIIDRPTD